MKYSVKMTAMLFLTVLLVGFGYGAEKPNVEITVYNSDLALVKEQRILDIPSGTAQVTFADVSAMLDPTTVALRIPEIDGLKLLEQNYEYDLVNEEKLLKKYLGQRITITDIGGTVFSGYLANTGNNVILTSNPNGGEVQIIKAGQIKNIKFPNVTDGIMSRPTLLWLLQNPGASQKARAEVSYLTGGISWWADYIATVNEDDTKLNLTAWVSLDNCSGISYNNALLKLVAGDVNRVRQEMAVMNTPMVKATGVSDGQVKEESLFEYHMYTVERPTTVKNNQLKQIEFLTADNVNVTKEFVYRGDSKVQTILRLVNDSANGLGIPLPKGTIRVQKADSSGSLQFIGEDSLKHTPKDEEISIILGTAFDIVGERVRLDLKRPATNVREETYKITLRNHKSETVEVVVEESLSSWNAAKILKANEEYEKIGNEKIRFKLSLAPDEEKSVEYTVQYKN